MVPIPESLYLPPLEKCFSGERRVISWKTAFEQLCTLHTSKHDATPLQPFLSDPESLKLLSTPFSTSRTASPQTKAGFETRTAAIHVTPAENGPYDIEQIKADTIWLARKASIDEITALRTVVLEWQDRAALQLLNGYSETERLSLQELMGHGGLLNAVVSTRPTALAGITPLTKDFNTQEARHDRLLRILLSEKEYLLAVAALIASSSLGGESDSHRALGAEKSGLSHHWLQQIGHKVTHAQGTGNQTLITGNADHMAAAIQAIKYRLQALERGTGWSDSVLDGDSLEEDFQGKQLVEIYHLLHIIFAQVEVFDSIQTAATVKLWFDFCDEYGFLSGFLPPRPQQQVLVEPIHYFILHISLAIIKLPLVVDYLVDEDARLQKSPQSLPYILDSECLIRITEILFDAAGRHVLICSLAALAWSIILQTMRTAVAPHEEVLAGSSTGSGLRNLPLIQKLKPLSFVLDSTMTLDVDDDPIAFLARQAVNDLGCFSVIIALAEATTQHLGASATAPTDLAVRFQLLQLIRHSLPHTGYGQEVFAATLAVLNCEDTAYHYQAAVKARLVEVFFSDSSILIPMVLRNAQCRYPYELNALLSIVPALAIPSAVDDLGEMPALQMLDSIPRFMIALPESFNGYELVREDENNNSIRLKVDLQTFLTRRDMRPHLPNGSNEKAVSQRDLNFDDVAVIPAGTFGYIVNESRPYVAQWIHEHSGIQYLSRMLATSVTGAVQQSITGPLQSDVVSDIIFDFAKLISSCVKAPSHRAGLQAAKHMLERSSEALEHGQNIISLVTDIFEEDIQRQLLVSRGEASTSVLSSCVSFFATLVPVVPGRVWPVLARSELLDIDGRSSKLTDLVAAVEMANAQYALMQSCLEIFDALIDDVVRNTVARKTPSTAVKRFEDDTSDISVGVPHKTIGKVLLSFTRAFTDILRSSLDWNFSAEDQRIQINTNIARSFDRLLELTYGFDDTNDISAKITASLAPSAAYVLEAFGSTHGEATALNRLIQLVGIAATLPSSPFFLHNAESIQTQTSAVLHFLTTLLNTGILQARNLTALAQNLNAAMPLLVHLFARTDVYKQSIVTLWTSLIKMVNLDASDPPSILSHVSAESSKHLLPLLAQATEAHIEEDLELSMLELCSAAVSQRQRWLATFLLTGETPKEMGRKGTAEKKLHWKAPFLSDALVAITNLPSIKPRRANAILQFLSLAQNHWPWVTEKIRGHPEAMTAMANFLDNLRDEGVPKDSDTAIMIANRNLTASHICDILAIYIYTARQLGDVGFLMTLIPKLGYLRAKAVEVPSYNSSLHKNLAANVSKCFAGLSLSTFKRTLPGQPFGPDYCYDTTFAAQVLGFHSAWQPSSKQGFSHELHRSNCNLSLVESQILLLKSWRSLLLELSSHFPLSLDLQKHMCGTCQNCLVANKESADNNEQIFEELDQTRVELATVLLQRLTSARSEVKRMLEILPATWSVVVSSGQDFEIAFVGTKADHYRSLLRLLFLSLQPYIYLKPFERQQNADDAVPSTALQLANTKNAAQSIPVLIEVVADVVAKGFHSLCTQLHEDATSVLPSDFALLTAILQSLLRIPNLQNTYSSISSKLYNSGVARNATALFSWSDRLTAADNDPIYGELSVQFLLELSAIPLMADHLAVEGILSELAAAPIVEYYHRLHGSSPFDDPPRLHSIWARGILPLCLNLLDTVGAPLAHEVASFLNSFTPQLRRASDALDPNPAPTSNPATTKSSTATNKPTTGSSSSTTTSYSRRKRHAGADTAGCITLAVAIELHSLALLSAMLDTFRGLPGVGVVAGTGDVPELQGWDRAGLKEDVEALLSGPREILRARILPGNERDVRLLKTPPASKDHKAGAIGAVDVDAEASSRLEELVVAELKGVIKCLGGS